MKSFVYRMTAALNAGSGNANANTNLGIGRGTINFRSIFITARYLDTTTNLNISGTSFLLIYFSNGPLISSMIPGMNNNYRNDIGISLSNNFYTKFFFRTTPGDQMNLDWTINLSSNAVNNLACTLYICYNGFEETK